MLKLAVFLCLQELSALREKHAVIQTSGYLEQTDFQAQLDTHLEEAIDELREKSENEIENYKTSVENAYRDKVSHTCAILVGLLYCSNMWGLSNMAGALTFTSVLIETKTVLWYHKPSIRMC